MQEEHGATDHRKKTKLVWAYMQEEGQQASDIWNDGRRGEVRKTVQRMVGRH